VRDAIGHACQEKLLAVAHARVADDDDVGPLLLGDAHDRLGGVGVVDKTRSPALPGEPLRELLEPRRRFGGAIRRAADEVFRSDDL
jgi:hypothetical protein